MHFKHACVAGLMTLLLTLWLFGFQLQAEGVGLTVVSQLGDNGPALLAGVAIVFFFQLFRQPILGLLGRVGSGTPKLVLPSQSEKPGLYRVGFWLMLLALILLPFLASRSVVDLATLTLIYVMLGLGLNVQVGLAGLLDLGYVGFYAVGAYSYALLNQYFGFGFWEALPLAGLLAAGFGFLLGFPVLRLRGDYLAIVTLGFGEVIRILLNNLNTITGGPNGISGIPKPTLFGLEFARKAEEGSQTFHQFFGIKYVADHKVIFLYLMAVLLVLLTLFVINRLLRMPLGRAWEALRED